MPGGKVAMAANARRFALRDQTRTNHESLDTLVGGLTDRAAYARYLRGMTLFRGHADAQLAAIAWPADGPARPHPLHAALLADMADLGLVPDVAPLPALPVGGVSACFGAVYVLEGSALGAKLLRRQAEALGLDAAFGARHLVQQTQGGGWAPFLAALDAVSDYDEDQAVAAARATFASARAAFRVVDGGPDTGI